MPFVDSIAATIRIPETLAEDINSVIGNSKEFSNYPDFVISAIRYHQIELMEIMEKTWSEVEKEKDPSKRISKYNEIMEQIRKNYDEDYDEYDGKAFTVILRIPPGLKKRCLDISAHSVKYPTFQKFARVATAHYCDYIDDMWTFNGFIEQRINESQIKIKDIVVNILDKNSDPKL